MTRFIEINTALLFCVLATAAGQATAGTYYDAVMADNPVGYWRLNDTGGTAVDAMGSHDGAYLGGVVQGKPGAIYGDSDLAAGFSANGQKVDIPHSMALNPASFTFECWAKVQPGAGTTHRSPMTSRDNSPSSGYIFYAQGGRWQFWTTPPAGWNPMLAPAGSVMEGQWAHLVGTYDAAAQEKKLYVNGLLAASQAGVSATPNGSKPLRIGAGATEGTGQFWFRGDIDEAAVYNSALTAPQIRHHYNVANSNWTSTIDFANPGGAGLGADASRLVLAGHTNASPTPSNPDGTLILGGSGSGGMVFTDVIDGGLNFNRPLVVETEAFYWDANAPTGPATDNAYFGLKALHLMGTGDSGADRRGGLFAQFAAIDSDTVGANDTGELRLGFQSARTGTSGDVWQTPGALRKTVSGIPDANGLFNMQLSIAGLGDDDPLLFIVGQDGWSDQITTTIGGYRNALSGDAQAAFDLVLTELRANPSLMNVGFVSTSARNDAYNYLRVFASVPEPSSVALLALGGLGLIGCGRRNRRRATGRRA